MVSAMSFRCGLSLFKKEEKPGAQLALSMEESEKVYGDLGRQAHAYNSFWEA